MPTYEFLCATCGPFEQRRSLKEASDPMTCPACQGVAQRMYSTSGVILTSGAARRRLSQSAEPMVVKVKLLRNLYPPRHSNSQFIAAPGSSVMLRIRRQSSQDCSAYNAPGRT